MIIEKNYIQLKKILTGLGKRKVAYDIALALEDPQFRAIIKNV